MKMQESSRSLKNCVKCDDFIMRSEPRFVDGCLHHHLNCGDKLTKAPTVFDRLIEWARSL